MKQEELARLLFVSDWPHDDGWKKRKDGDVARERYLRLAAVAFAALATQ